MSGFALYRPGDSVVHAVPAGPKLLVLLAAGVGSAFVRGPVPAIWGLAVVVCLYFLASFGPRVLWRQLRPALWLAVPLAAYHVVVNGVARAVTVVGLLLVLLLLATLVSLTTRTTDLLDVVVRLLRPLRRLGVDADRAGIALALGVRSVPVVLGLAAEVREAQLARGLTASPRAFGVPLVVRSLRYADELGEALAARGLDD